MNCINRVLFAGIMAAAALASNTFAADVKGGDPSGGGPSGGTPPVRQLTGDLYISGQVPLESVAALRQRGFATLIDLRPDGEAVDQPSSSAVQAAAQTQGIRFHYLPVQNGVPIPARTVDALQSALASSPRPILLYCRSGHRAARTWSLVEASRPGGMDTATILATVKAAGQSADDLSPAIAERIANRATAGISRP